MEGKAEGWVSPCSVCTLPPRPSPPPQIGEKEGEPKETQGINWKDVETLMKKLGEDLPDEEAEEMIVQADFFVFHLCGVLTHS